MASCRVSPCLNSFIMTFSGDDPRSDSDEDLGPPKGNDRSVPRVLDCDKDGYPVLPAIEDLSLPVLKDICRSFTTMTYRGLLRCNCFVPPQT
jgi:hypothetical protein